MARSSTRRKDPAKTFEDQLTKYREMRDFNVTAEPRGSKTAIKAVTETSDLPFVIQKHAASHLHYDFRLGWLSRVYLNLGSSGATAEAWRKAP